MRGASTIGSARWLSAPARPWAGHVLHDRQDTGVQHALGGGTAEHRHGERVPRVGAVADHVVCALDRHVEDRQAVDIDADGPEVLADEPSREPDRGGAGFEIPDRGEARRGGILAPVRRPEPLHAAALLIDEDEGVVAPYRVPDVAGQRADLLRRFDVAAEQDDAERVGGPQEGALVVVKARPEAAADEGTSHGKEVTGVSRKGSSWPGLFRPSAPGHRDSVRPAYPKRRRVNGRDKPGHDGCVDQSLATKQEPPSAFSFEQRLAASAFVRLDTRTR